MGAYTVPKEISKMKPKGTTVKVINCIYYVYTNTRHKDEASGKWKTNPGRLVGKIIRDVGFVPNGTQVGSPELTLFEYGDYLLACALARDDFERLKECFNVEGAVQWRLMDM